MTAERLRSAIRLGLYALVLLAPLPFGSVQPWAVMALELVATVLACLALVVLNYDSDARASVPRGPLAVCGVLVLLGLFQVVPLPFALADRFNPTAELLRPLVPYLDEGARPTVTWSVAAPETVDALLRFAAYVFVGFAAAVGFDDAASRRRLAWVLAATAAFQAIYGSGEYLSGRQHIFGFAKKHYLDSATGTFINRNHFASLLAMALPFALSLSLEGGGGKKSALGWRERVIGISDPASLQRLLAMVAAGLIWIGLLLSHSRAGLVAGIVAVVIVLLHHRRARVAQWVAAIGALVLVGLLTLEVSQAPGERFLAVAGDLEAKGGRVTVWRDASSLVAARPVLGWGFGAFESAFRNAQSTDITLAYDHAHNEWLEWTVEGGALTLTLAVALLAVLLRRADVAARAALVAIAAQSLWEFSLRIPALALIAAALAGAALAAYSEKTSSRAAVTAFPPPSMKVSNQISRFSRFQIR